MEREIIQTSDGSSTNFSIKKENFEELSADSQNHQSGSQNLEQYLASEIIPKKLAQSPDFFIPPASLQKQLQKSKSLYQFIPQRQLTNLITQFQYNKQKQGYSFNLLLPEIAKRVNLDLNTVSNIYQEYLVDPDLLKRKMAIDYTKYSKNLPSSVVDDFRQHYVKKVVQFNPMLSIRQIYKIIINIPALQQISKVETLITMPIIKKILKKVGYVKKNIRKVLQTSNTSTVINGRYIYCQFYKHKREFGDQFQFLGCTDFHYLMYRNRGWAKQDEVPSFDKTCDPMKMLSLMTVICSQKIVAHTIKFGIYSIEQQLNFLFKIIAVSKKKSLQKTYIVIDSCLLKHYDEIQSQVTKQKCPFEVIYLPPKSPLISPLEHMFKKIKGLMQFKKFKNNNHLHDCLKETIKKYESISMQKFYDEAEKYVQMGTQKALM